MTVKDFIEKQNLNVLVEGELDREITTCYIGDLLSWVMGRAQNGDVWITIMSNINIVAVATLCDTACILLAEGVTVDEEVKKTAEARNVNILSSPKSAYALAKEISGLSV